MCSIIHNIEDIVISDRKLSLFDNILIPLALSKWSWIDLKFCMIISQCVIFKMFALYLKNRKLDAALTPTKRREVIQKNYYSLRFNMFFSCFSNRIAIIVVIRFMKMSQVVQTFILRLYKPLISKKLQHCREITCTMKVAVQLIVSAIALVNAWSPPGPGEPCAADLVNETNEPCANRCEMNCENIGESADIYQLLNYETCRGDKCYCKPGFIRNDDGDCVVQKRNTCGECTIPIATNCQIVLCILSLPRLWSLRRCAAHTVETLCLQRWTYLLYRKMSRLWLHEKQMYL
jgi:Trypsin Inhibitor like cysteine rich domain